MALKNNVGLELQADADSDGTQETGLFEFATDVQIQTQYKSSLVLNQTGDRATGALVKLLEEDGTPARRGISIDSGGGRIEHRISFREPDGGSNSWGDTSDGSDGSDATGESARRKKAVLMRYVKTGLFDSRSPATLYLGEYESRDGTNGVYEPSITCTVSDVDLTIDAESDQILDGQITLVEIASLQQATNAGRRGR